ncbi:MAG: SRPBCC family protein [bacterium]
MDRRYARGDRAGAETHVITLSRVYPQDQAKVWAAFASGERLSRWFLPVTGDLRVGGSFQFEGNAGGAIEACDKPDRIAVTWGMMGSFSWVELLFAPEGAGTRVTLRHTVKAADLPLGMWDKFGTGAVGSGWEGGFLGLEMYLAAPEVAKDAAAMQAWPGTPEGRAFFRASAEAWAEAAIAGGADAATMRATVPELIAFYTGAPA